MGLAVMILCGASIVIVTAALIWTLHEMQKK